MVVEGVAGGVNVAVWAQSRVERKHSESQSETRDKEIQLCLTLPEFLKKLGAKTNGKL